MNVTPRSAGTIVAGFVGSLIAAYSLGFLQSAWSAAPVSPSVTASQGLTADAIGVNRARKGARLTALQPAQVTNQAAANTDVAGAVASIEFAAGSVLYRDRSGLVLFRTDSVANTLVVLKTAAAPRALAGPAAGVSVRTISFEKPQTAPASVLMLGCDRLASVLADPTTRHLTGRCLS